MDLKNYGESIVIVLRYIKISISKQSSSTNIKSYITPKIIKLVRKKVIGKTSKGISNFDIFYLQYRNTISNIFWGLISNHGE